ncbi:hypothetical protein BASA81_014055 [Batrachochytrium salamandrivorans]|nr:hypothetical protein BASA81_014055 [Batrachochytrium salamandrivorans]
MHVFVYWHLSLPQHASTILLVLVAAAVYGDPTKKTQPPPGGVKKPGRSGRDLWRLPRIALRAIHTDSRPSADSVYQWFNPKAGLNSAAIAANPSTSVSKPVDPTSSVTTLEKRGNTDKTSIFPTLFDKTMTAPLVLSTSTSKRRAFEFPQISVTWEGDLDITAVLALKAQADIVLKSPDLTLFEYPFGPIYIPGILNLGPSVKLVASARVSLTAAISAELEISCKMPKFFAKLSPLERKHDIPLTLNIQSQHLPLLRLVARQKLRLGHSWH